MKIWAEIMRISRGGSAPQVKGNGQIIDTLAIQQYGIASGSPENSHALVISTAGVLHELLWQVAPPMRQRPMRAK